jgi:hypothetical protein
MLSIQAPASGAAPVAPARMPSGVSRARQGLRAQQLSTATAAVLSKYTAPALQAAALAQPVAAAAPAQPAAAAVEPERASPPLPPLHAPPARASLPPLPPWQADRPGRTSPFAAQALQPTGAAARPVAAAMLQSTATQSPFASPLAPEAAWAAIEPGGEQASAGHEALRMPSAQQQGERAPRVAEAAAAEPLCSKLRAWLGNSEPRCQIRRVPPPPEGKLCCLFRAASCAMPCKYASCPACPHPSTCCMPPGLSRWTDIVNERAEVPWHAAAVGDGSFGSVHTVGGECEAAPREDCVHHGRFMDTCMTSGAAPMRGGVLAVGGATGARARALLASLRCTALARTPVPHGHFSPLLAPQAFWRGIPVAVKVVKCPEETAIETIVQDFW